MLATVIIFLPLAVTLFWMIIHSMMASRTDSYASLMCLLTSVTLFLLSDCCYYDPSATYPILTIASNLSQMSATCIIPLLLIYLHRIRTGEGIRARQLTWAFIPIVLFTVAELLTFTVGRPVITGFIEKLYTVGDSALDSVTEPGVRSYYLFAVVIFRVSIAVELLSLFISYFNNTRRHGFRFRNITGFLFKGEKISVLELQYANIVPIFLLTVVKMSLFRDYLLEHVWITMILSVLAALFISMVCYIAFFAAKKNIVLEDLFNVMRFNYNQDNKEEVVEEMLAEMISEADDGTLMRLQHRFGLDFGISAESVAAARENDDEPSLAERIFSAVTRSIDEDSLMGRFEHLMMIEKIFLQPGLTLAEVADRLNSNKTYVSKMVNSSYNIGFPDLVNTLRIDYAEDYLVHHRDARQEDIAKACGFPSASSLNNTFKKITGMTPRIWLATHDRNNSQES